MQQKYTGIILSKKDSGEADRIYSIYTREVGKIRAKAVGVRKTASKLAGSLENFVLADFAIVRKNGIGKITSSIVENNFSKIKENYDVLTLVFKSLSLVDKLIISEEKDENVFNLLQEYLQTANELDIQKKEKIILLSYGFIFKLLKILGYAIEVGRCRYCDRQLDQKNNFFSAVEGGIICADCVTEAKNTISVSVNTIKLMRLFLTNNPSSMIKIKTNSKEIEEVGVVLKIFLNQITN